MALVTFPSGHSPSQRCLTLSAVNDVVKDTRPPRDKHPPLGLHLLPLLLCLFGFDGPHQRLTKLRTLAAHLTIKGRATLLKNLMVVYRICATTFICPPKAEIYEAR